jgi:very-short-patch-repair endonuclease
MYEINEIYEKLRIAIIEYFEAIKAENATNNNNRLACHPAVQTTRETLHMLWELTQVCNEKEEFDEYLHHSLNSTLEELIETWNRISSQDRWFYESTQQEKTFLAKAESPIEEMFIKAMKPFYDYFKMEVQYNQEHPYRIDVAFPDLQIAVELDGHEFHASKEARKRDASRDRDLMRRGWSVVRFTGSEIFNNVHECAHELVEILDDATEQKGGKRLFPVVDIADNVLELNSKHAN